MSKRRRAETSGQATSPKLGPKTQTRVHALQQPARRRTAPLVARFEAAAEDPAVIASLLLGPGHSSQARSLLLSDSCVAATRVFEHLQSPSYSKGEEDIQMLLKRSNLFITLGGCPAAVHREWTRLNRAVAGDETLRALTRPSCSPASSSTSSMSIPTCCCLPLFGMQLPWTCAFASQHPHRSCRVSDSTTETTGETCCSSSSAAHGRPSEKRWTRPLCA